MASKDTYPQNGGGETEQPAEEGLHPSISNCPTDNSSSSSQQQVQTLPEVKKKGNDAGHGNRFQSKLLMLYAVRAINAGYQFHLGTELSVGEKFDDLIFHYKAKDDVTFRQQYLQAKHRENENTKQIKANHLLDVKKGDFSLLKYFQSYVKIVKGNAIEHCIICTNVDFDHRDITNNGITLEHVDEENWPKILNCKDEKNEQACYKLKNLGNLKNTLLNCIVDCTDEEIKSLFKNCTKEVDGKPFNENTADEMKNFFINFQNQNQIEKTLIETVFDYSKNSLSILNCIVNCTGEQMKSLFQNCTEVVNGKSFNEHTADEMKNFFINSRNQNQVGLEKKIIETVFDYSKNSLSILNCIVNCTGEQMKSLFQNCTEKVNGKQFNDHTDDEMKNFFINSRNQNQLVQKLVQIVFLDNMIFAVKTPNESELDGILTKAVGNYFNLRNAALQSAHFMNEMVNWFKLTDKDNYWLTPKKAKVILNEKTNLHIKVMELTSFSLDYQGKLKQIKTSENSELEFEDTVINELTAMLQSFWKKQEKIKHVSSKTTKLTAVKVFSAIKKLPEFSKKDDYLVISSKRLGKNQTEIKELLKSNINNGHRLLVVVNKEAGNPLRDESYLEFIPDKKETKVIVISNQNGSKESHQDTITFGQLHENTKKVLEDKQVSFQGNDLTVNRLIDMKHADNVLDSQTIENLLQMAEDNKIVVPSFNTSSLGKYIKRKLKFPSKDQLLKKLADIEKKPEKKVNEEIEIDQNGNIKWKTKDDKRKQEIWEKITVLLKQINSSDLSLLSTVSERELIDASNKRIIITDVAGTGKSTILSNYYEEIKKAKSDYLVIKISLMNYSKALMNEKSINEFLINNVMGQNAFARQLLKHRLETDDGIILMLDGFDEIDYGCQKKVVELVKTLNESIPLYITTRPHLADQLQFELSQLAYSLDRFTEEDQINYLTVVWEKYLKEVSYNKETIKTFARQLIDRVSETLKDKENEFIGIPLQCRILAECFQSKIKDEIDKSSDDADLSHLIGDQQFDLSNLYKSLIDEKRRVFRQEKIEEISRNGHIVNNSIEYTIYKTERHLRKLAVQLIVNKQKDVNILIPSAGFQSESEKKKKEKKLNEFGIRFGLVDVKGENGIEFLHRTLAEYLVADFIFNGFLLDQEKHNKLLENESIRKWIIEEMLVNNNYEGVRVFFDSMLKEIIFQEEWKNKIQNNQLPLRLQQFATLLRSEIEKIWSFERAFVEINSNITLLIFDCLDTSSHKIEISSVILRQSWNEKSFFRQRTDVFDRCLNYFDKASDDELKELTNILISELYNNEQQQIENKNLERFLVFVGRHKDVDWNFHELTVFFIRSEMEEETRKKFFEILTSKYLKDLNLTLLMAIAIFESHKHFNFSRLIYINIHVEYKIGEIEKALTILRELRRIKVAGELSRFVLLRKSETLKKEENAKFRLSLEKMGMTGLHGAAFVGNLSLIEKEIGCSLENPENCSEEERKSVLHLMTNDLVPPFYVAAAYGHDDICKKIFNFLDLKKEISDTKGFLHRSLKDAIKYENVVMIQTILKCVKEIQGQNDLVKLLQSVIYYFTPSKSIVKTITDIFMQDTENGCRDLNDLVFSNWETLEILKHVECDVLQKMIAAAGGFDNWIKRLMDTHLQAAFGVLPFDGFLDNLNQENQISRLIDILIAKSTLDDNQRSEPSTSYWSDFVLKTSLSWRMREFISAISKCAGEEDLKRLLLYNDDKNILILLQYLIRNGRSEFNKILSHLPENLRKEIESEEEKTKLIDHFFSTPTFLESLFYGSQQLNAIEYYLENGNEKQLAKFSQVVKVHHLEEALWGEKEKGKKIAGLLKEKPPMIDSQTVVKYNEIIEKLVSIS